MNHLPKLLLKIKIYRKIYTKLCIYFSDAHFVSYPKSGRTWVKHFLAKYYSVKYNIDEFLEFGFLKKAHRSIPRIGFTHRGLEAKSLTEMQDDILALYPKIKKFVFMVRDPRDVLVSHYYHMVEREGNKYGFDSISEFIKDDVYGIKRIYRIYKFLV